MAYMIKTTEKRVKGGGEKKDETEHDLSLMNSILGSDRKALVIALSQFMPTQQAQCTVSRKGFTYPYVWILVNVDTTNEKIGSHRRLHTKLGMSWSIHYEPVFHWS